MRSSAWSFDSDPCQSFSATSREVKYRCLEVYFSAAPLNFEDLCQYWYQSIHQHHFWQHWVEDSSEVSIPHFSVQIQSYITDLCQTCSSTAGNLSSLWFSISAAVFLWKQDVGAFSFLVEELWRALMLVITCRQDLEALKLHLGSQERSCRRFGLLWLCCFCFVCSVAFLALILMIPCCHRHRIHFLSIQNHQLHQFNTKHHHQYADSDSKISSFWDSRLIYHEPILRCSISALMIVSYWDWLHLFHVAASHPYHTVLLQFYLI